MSFFICSLSIFSFFSRAPLHAKNLSCSSSVSAIMAKSSVPTVLRCLNSNVRVSIMKRNKNGGQPPQGMPHQSVSPYFVWTVVLAPHTWSSLTFPRFSSLSLNTNKLLFSVPVMRLYKIHKTRKLFWFHLLHLSNLFIHSIPNGGHLRLLPGESLVKIDLESPQECVKTTRVKKEKL